MHKKRIPPSTIVATALVLLGFTAAQANAQTLFRCGKTYQDRPCDTGQESKLYVPTRPAASGMQGSGDAACAQRGVDAQKVAWTREAGAVLEQQLAKARHDGERKLIADVYSKRGTSAEIRASIEAECVAEKERAARFGNGAPAPSTPDNAGAAAKSDKGTRQQSEERYAGNAAASEAERKRMACVRLRAELEAIREQQRTGGSAATMDALSREKSDIERQLSRDAC